MHNMLSLGSADPTEGPLADVLEPTICFHHFGLSLLTHKAAYNCYLYANESQLSDMGLVRGTIIKLKAHLMPSVLGANGNASNLAATVRATTSERRVGVKER